MEHHAKHDLAQHIVSNLTYEGKLTLILHLGDLDPSGVSIYDSMREDVLAFVATDVPHKDPDGVAVFERIALTPEQVGKYGLTTYPPKPTDLRSGRWSGETCQLEALPPDTLAFEVDAAIMRHLDSEVLATDREAGAQERRKIALALPSGDDGDG